MADTKLTPTEQEKLAILTATLEGKITNATAAKQLQLSIRQVQRAKATIRTEGSRGVIHKLKGKSGNHRIDETTKKQVLTFIEKNYADFKPTFATEKLEEQHAINISPETTRLWMIEKGLWKSHTHKRRTYRAWRPRKEFFGELQQFDGCYHYWFEERLVDENGNPIEICLLAAIDDATGIITKAHFAPNEGVNAVFTFWKDYLKEHGKPAGIYLDSFSTYKINHKYAVDNKELLTQFERAMLQLNIQLITAHSAEAKGRIERLFLTLQDRLVKEMRLAQISTPEDGNRFLTELFLSQFNRKFAVKSTQEGNVHRLLLPIDIDNLQRIFSVQSIRRVNNDFTIQFKNQWYQLAEIQPTTVRAGDHISVEEWLNETIHFSLRDNYLMYTVLPEKPHKVIQQPLILTTHKLIWKPPANHPWRKLYHLKS